MGTPGLPPVGSTSIDVDRAVRTALDHHDLRILEIVYYIAGTTTALFSCVFLIHFTMFLVFGLNPQIFNQHGHAPQNPPPAGFFLIGAAIIGTIILLGWTFGALQILAGRALKKRRHRLFVLIVAGLECIFVPWGTALGVMTLIVMQRPTIKSLFGE